MIYKIKFEYIDSLKNDCLTMVSSSFEENGIKYVKEVMCLETQQTYPTPPYCAEKNFKGILQSQYPNARISVLNSHSGAN